MPVRSPVANVGWALTNLPSWWRYRRALERPAEVQARLLHRYLRRNAETAFGQAHGFGRIRSVEDYRARVPLRRYDEYGPFVQRIAGGEPHVLTAERVTRLALTSGSTAAAKLIPYTASLQAEYGRAIGPWMIDLYAARPGLAGGPAYWSLTPRLPRSTTDTGGVPVGFDEDSAYLGGIARRLVDAAMAVPSIVQEIADHDVHRYVTLLFLLRARGLRLISVWHPSYLTLLLDAARGDWELLLADVRTGGGSLPARLPRPLAAALQQRLRPDPRRADELRDVGSSECRRIWPALEVVSCWGDGAARSAISDLQRELRGVSIQAKGLLATEAAVTLPFRASPAPVRSPCTADAGAEGPKPLAIRSHFFEFAAPDGRVLLAHELEPGGTYGVVVTTGGGFYRYVLGDRVQVDGFVGGTPSLSFLARDGQLSDHVGEKLHEAFVASVIARLFADGSPPRFAMLAPERTGGRVSYALFVEPARDVPPDLGARLEAALCENPHYALAVGLGQLVGSRVMRIRDGFRTYAQQSAARGRRLGDVKPIALDLDTGWSAVFEPATAHAAPEDEPCTTG